MFLVGSCRKLWRKKVVNRFDYYRNLALWKCIRRFIVIPWIYSIEPHPYLSSFCVHYLTITILSLFFIINNIIFLSVGSRATTCFRSFIFHHFIAIRLTVNHLGTYEYVMNSYLGSMVNGRKEARLVGEKIPTLYIWSEGHWREESRLCRKINIVEREQNWIFKRLVSKMTWSLTLLL